MQRIFIIFIFILIFLAFRDGCYAQNSTAQTDMTLDAAARAQIIDVVTKNMKDYISYQKSRSKSRNPPASGNGKRNTPNTSATELAKLLTAQLREISLE